LGSFSLQEEVVKEVVRQGEEIAAAAAGGSRVRRGREAGCGSRQVLGAY
jgi:hypothetical protein